MTSTSRSKNPPKSAKTPIRQALWTDSALQPLVQDGLAALEKTHRELIDDKIKNLFADSLDLDESLRSDHPQENRWDYLIGYLRTKSIVAIESHTMNDKAVSVVIEKRKAALRQLAGHLRDGKSVAAWIPSVPT